MIYLIFVIVVIVLTIITIGGTEVTSAPDVLKSYWIYPIVTLLHYFVKSDLRFPDQINQIDRTQNENNGECSADRN